MEEERFARLNHRDSETSLDPTHFRMYASGQGRWLSPDPLMGHPFNPQTFDRYGYALGNPARFTDPTGQDPTYCEFMTIGGEFAGGGCDYTGGSSDYLNPYQEYEYNCMAYPAGCGYYNGMPVPNYPSYGDGGYTPTPPPSQLPSSTKTWPSTGPSSCSIYPPGSLANYVCNLAPNTPVMNSIRGCLQQGYIPGFGYVPAFSLSNPNFNFLESLDLRLGFAEHAYCLPEGMLNP